MTTLSPGGIWTATNGTRIQAHGGGFFFENGVYYWYGEDKNAPNVVNESGSSIDRVDIIGIHCYSSKDLVSWTDEDLVLKSAPENPSHDLFPKNVLERPKVLKCPKTQKYVLWAHVDSPDYKKASLGVAISDFPTGPFTYLHSFRPYGHDSRDMTLFQDADGAGYVFFSSEGCLPGKEVPSWNATQRIARLTDDFLGVAHEPMIAFDGELREAPAVFVWGGRYWQITSGCTGWYPNPAGWHVADHPLGPWTTGGDPCVGDTDGTTFSSQGTFVLSINGRPDDFLLCADRWNPKDLQDSRYVWLNLSMASGQPVVTCPEP
jgi:hypothetical protein